MVDLVAVVVPVVIQIMRPMPVVAVVILVAAAAVAAIDLAAKAASEVRLADSSVDLGLLQLQLAYNSGMAFSMGDKLPVGVIEPAVRVSGLTHVTTCPLGVDCMACWVVLRNVSRSDGMSVPP